MPRPGLLAPLRGLSSAFTFLAVLVLISSTLAASPVAAADPPAMSAKVLLDGHARVGSWMAIAVRIRNDGPEVVGELRLNAGAQGRTRYGTQVDLPTTSDKTFVLYAQPPSFGGSVQVDLVSDGRTVTSQNVKFTVHDATQLVVGVVAEKPQGIVPSIDLLPSPNGAGAATIQLTPADLPDRIEGWASLDRLIWQDVDSSSLTTEQLDSLRGWLAAGGRLVVVGGTAGLSVLSGFPDDILPYRPTATVDVAPETLAGLLGELPKDAADVPALAGELTRGTALATSGDRVIAAEAAHGSGDVTILGFDAGTKWMTDAKIARGLWRRFLPPRTNVALIGANDSQLVQAVQQQPALALPPIGGLLALLFGYILLIGPINYLVLRKLDRREWAWVTMPVLIAVFAIGAYAFGAALRGLDVIVNEVAIVRGAPDAVEGTAQAYLGVFSPSRGSYQVEVPGGALLSSTLVGDFASGGDSQSLDILQGKPSRIRDLTVGVSSLRTVRAETQAVVPKVHAEVSLVEGTLTGTIRNDSDQVLERPAVVLGNSAVVLSDLPPGVTAPISLQISSGQFGQSLSDKIVGQIFFGDPSKASDSASKSVVRHAILDQLTLDPTVNASVGLSSESPVLLAWGTRQVVDLRISGQTPRRTGNVLYYIPLSMKVRGHVAFDGDLIRTSIVDTTAGSFNKDPFSMNMGIGRATVAYRPIGFDGTLSATKVLLGMNFGGDFGRIGGEPQPIAPVAVQPCSDRPQSKTICVDPEPPAVNCDKLSQDCSGAFEQVPQVDVFDRRGNGTWVRLSTLSVGANYVLRNPDRYVDPATGAILVRFVNDNQDGIGFQFQVRIEGDVR